MLSKPVTFPQILNGPSKSRDSNLSLLLHTLPACTACRKTLLTISYVCLERPNKSRDRLLLPRRQSSCSCCNMLHAVMSDDYSSACSRLHAVQTLNPVQQHESCPLKTPALTGTLCATVQDLQASHRIGTFMEPSCACCTSVYCSAFWKLLTAPLSVDSASSKSLSHDPHSSRHQDSNCHHKSQYCFVQSPASIATLCADSGSSGSLSQTGISTSLKLSSSSVVVS